MPRLAFTCVDGATSASLTHMGLGPGPIPGESGEAGPATRDPGLLTGERLSRKLRSLAAGLGESLTELRPSVTELDPRLLPGLRRTSRKVRDELSLLAAKLERSAANKVGGHSRHERRVRAWTRPLGQRQDEVLSPFPFLARFGRGWIDALLEATPAVPRSGRWVELSED